MNQNQNPTVNGRSVASSNLPQRSGRTSFLPKKVDSSASCVSPSIQRSTPSAVGRTDDNKQAIDTPVKAFLSSNITPRSSSRKARVESALSTPNGTPGGTPSNSRPSSMVYSPDRDAENANEIISLRTRRLSLGRTVRSPSVSSDRPASALSLRPASKERELHSAKATLTGHNPKFFHADDIRPALASIPSERVIEQGIANGFATPRGRDDAATSKAFLGSSPPVDELGPKFFYASDVAESAATPKPPTMRAMRVPYPIHTGASPTASSGPQQQRATSPLKEEIVSRRSSLSKPRRHTRLVSNPNVGLELDGKSSESISISQSNISRRSSMKSPETPQIGHARSSSIGPIAPYSARRGSVAGSEGPVVDIPETNVMAEPESLPSKDEAPSMLHQTPSGTTAGKATVGQSKLDHMNELAASARRERKVLDLEISNSSLLAINRTLEREMRKQNAELRRFRRRSQPGRLSTAPASRSVSNALSTLSRSDQAENDSEDFSGRSSLSFSIDDEEDSSDDASGRSSNSNTSQQLSHSLRASGTSRLRDKDAKRMHQDLARHRELLVDSQKLNESIKRCLGRTGDMIADAKKALEYHVQIDGLETRGGRVLLPDELEDGEIGEQRQGLLSPGVTDRKGMEWELDKPKKEEEAEEAKEKEAEEAEEVEEAEETENEPPEPGDAEISEFEDETAPLPKNPTADIIKSDQPKPSDSITLPPAVKPPLPPHSIFDRNHHAKPDVLTPDEPPPMTGGTQTIKDYLANLGPAWGL